MPFQNATNNVGILIAFLDKLSITSSNLHFALVQYYKETR